VKVSRTEGQATLALTVLKGPILKFQTWPDA